MKIGNARLNIVIKIIAGLQDFFNLNCRVADHSSFIFLSGRWRFFSEYNFKNINQKSIHIYIHICICCIYVYSGVTKRRETRETRESTKRVGCTQFCRKNNGSFNYRIDCLEFLLPGAILPFHPFFLSASLCFLFLFFFVILVSVNFTKQSSARLYTRAPERIASFSIYVFIRTHEFAPTHKRTEVKYFFRSVPVQDLCIAQFN